MEIIDFIISYPNYATRITYVTGVILLTAIECTIMLKLRITIKERIRPYVFKEEPKESASCRSKFSQATEIFMAAYGCRNSGSGGIRVLFIT